MTTTAKSARVPSTPTTRARTAGDVMTTPAVTVPEHATAKQIITTMSRHRVNAVPVVDHDGHAVGVVTASDLLARMSGERGAVPRGHRLTAPREQFRKESGRTARELMTRPAITVAATESIRSVAESMGRARVRCVPVLDADRLPVGMVSKRDLLTTYLRPDADIRQEIEDEVLARTFLVEPFTVEVSVADGIVVLDGFVQPAALLDLLLDNIAAVPGVIEIDDTRLRTPAPSERRHDGS